MRRVLLFSLGSIAALPLAGSLSACDPDLTVHKSASDAATPTPTSSSTSDAKAPPPADASADADAGTQTDASTQDAAPTAHVIDGTNDFAAGETFATSSALYTAYISWDSKSVYFGMAGEDIGKPASDLKWVLVYFGGSAGTNSGISYNEGGTSSTPQQAALSFSAQYHVRLKTDLSYVNGQGWSGSAWTDAVGLVPDCERKAQFVECRVARSSLGNPSRLKMHVTMIKEKSGEGWTYAAVPQTSLVDGNNPTYAKFFDFDLDDASKAPNTYTAQ